jgi:hypothetical protein
MRVKTTQSDRFFHASWASLFMRLSSGRFYKERRYVLLSQVFMQ